MFNLQCCFIYSVVTMLLTIIVCVYCNIYLYNTIISFAKTHYNIDDKVSSVPEITK